MITDVSVPQLNPNDDRVKVAEILVAEGEHVAAGKPLFVVETSKGTFDVEAPREGWVRNIRAGEGEELCVGDGLCLLSDAPDEPLPAAASGPQGRAAEEASVLITAKARQLAEEQGIDWRTIDKEGIITERDIHALVDPNLASGGAGAGAAVRSRVPCVVMGAGGAAGNVLEMLAECRHIEVRGFVDPALAKGTVVSGYPVLGDDAVLPELNAAGVSLAVINCGLTRLDPQLRVRVFNDCARAGMILPPLVHSSAIVDPSAKLGAGVQVFARAVVGPDVVLDNGVVVNTGAIVSHDCRIGAHTHVAPGAILAGQVRVGARCLIGMGATVLAYVEIGDDVIVNNGRNILRPIASGTHVR